MIFSEAVLERCKRCDEKDIKDVYRIENLMQREELGDDGRIGVLSLRIDSKNR
jgi:hypothetical protein